MKFEKIDGKVVVEIEAFGGEYLDEMPVLARFSFSSEDLVKIKRPHR